jgi:hypothetical protein
VIPTTAPADRDGNRSNYLAWGVVQLPAQDRELSLYAKEAYYTGPGSRLRRFRYRVDGFVSLHAPADGGELLTRPLRFQGEQLELNFVTARGGSVRVEVQDADGKAITQSDELQGDEVAGLVKWNQASLKGLAGKPVRLRFVLRDADLFAYRFR